MLMPVEKRLPPAAVDEYTMEYGAQLLVVAASVVVVVTAVVASVVVVSEVTSA